MMTIVLSSFITFCVFVVLPAEYSYYRCLCIGFSQSAVWWSQPGRLWLQPHPAVGATTLLWQPAHERHASGDDAQCGQRDWTPTEPRQRGCNHWPNRGDSLLLLLTLRYLTMKHFNLFVVKCFLKGNEILCENTV